MSGQVPGVGAVPGLGATGGAGGVGGPVGLPGVRPAPGAADAAEGPSFAQTLKQILGEVSGAQERSGDTIRAFLQGEGVELHEVMAAAEEAGIALEMLIEIRNKLAEAYRTVIGMQS